MRLTEGETLMWKKEDGLEPAMMGRPDVSPAPAPERVAPVKTGSVERATIGRSITIRGEVTGDEDLLIQGRIDGSVNLKQHAVTVGREGEVKADIVGRVITVEGSVEGNLRAEEQVVLRSSALVQGDIAAPRVVLEDGARFRGGVDMGEPSKAEGAGRSVASMAPQANRPLTGSGEAPSRLEATGPAGQGKLASSGKADGTAQKPVEAAP
jgi:cytoskeletal protein CcmA (bactofilin family)